MAEEDTLLPADPECSSPRLAETPTVEELEELLNTGRPSGNLESQSPAEFHSRWKLSCAASGDGDSSDKPALPFPASSIDSQEAGMSGAFPSMHRRHIVVHLPTCLPEEDPGTRDASVQVGVTCEDKATQWEEREAADPSLDKPSGANTTGRAVRKGGEQTTPATSGPSAPTTPQRARHQLAEVGPPCL
ncbi:UNVERIFIED_CONTAM: hypothetical protein K2H54_005088 [Gekko kuhli]